MDRRSFFVAASSLAASGVSSAASRPSAKVTAADRNLPGRKGLRLSITWGMLGRMPVTEALALLARRGYDAYEMFDWRDPKVLETFVSERQKYPLVCECLVGNKGVTAPGCGLVNPREREEFLRQTSLAIDAAKKVGCPQLVTMTDDVRGSV